jgi:hypothetical protein
VTDNDDDDDKVTFALSRTAVICSTVAFVALVGAGFGSCLYHCENQAARRLRCVELTRDLDRCSNSFAGAK